MPAKGQASKSCATKSISCACRVRNVCSNAGQMSDYLTLYDSCTVTSFGNEKRLTRPGSNLGHRSEQAHGFFFVHEKKVGLIQSSGRIVRLFTDEMQRGSCRDTPRTSFSTGTHDLVLLPEVAEWHKMNAIEPGKVGGQLC
jgi:hypothetical protein